jgi:hypothetical protein
MSFHHRYVHTVTRRQQGAVLDDLAGTNNVSLLDRKNIVHAITIWKAGPIASLLSIAAYRWTIS